MIDLTGVLDREKHPARTRSAIAGKVGVTARKPENVTPSHIERSVQALAVAEIAVTIRALSSPLFLSDFFSVQNTRPNPVL